MHLDDDFRETMPPSGAESFPDLQASALGCLLLDAATYVPIAKETLTPAHFDPDYRRLFELIISLGPHADIALVGEAVRSDPTLSMSFSFRHLGICMESASTAKQFPYYAAALDRRLRDPASLDTQPHTDLGVARRFAARHRDDFRYVAVRDRWYRWDGASWREDLTNVVVDACGSLVRELSIAAGGDEISAKAARKQEQAARIKGALTLAGADERLRLSDDQFDSDPGLVAFLNGVVDLRDGTFRPPARGDYILKRIPHEYHANATCPRWERFLAEVMAERQDLVTFISRFAGYCLTPETREHALMLAIGGGSNGKSTFVETLMRVIGPDFSCPAPPSLLMAQKGERHPTEIFDLKGRRLVVASEVPKHGAFSEERVKWLTGGDRIKGRAMRQDFSEFEPTHKFLLCANHMPTVKDPTDGFWRRIRVVPFDVSFRGREDRSLVETLRQETPGIVAWLVRAAREWIAEGLGDPIVVRSATKAYRLGEDVLGRFLEGFHPTSELTLAQILGAYREWCEANGEPEPRGGKTLSADLSAAGWESRHTKTGNVWHRVTSNSVEDYEFEDAP